MSNKKPDRKPRMAQATDKKSRKTQTRKSETGNWRQIFRLHKLTASQALRRMRLAPISSFMTILILGVTLSLPTTLAIALDNLRSVTGGRDMGSVRISVYLQNGLGDDVIQTLQEQIKSNSSVAEITYISPEQGLQEFELHSGLGSILALLNENPLPGVIEVTPTDITPLVIRNLLINLKHLPGIANAHVDNDWLKRLNVLLELGERTIIGFSVIIGLAALLIIGGITHLLVVNRKDEIQIVKLVGGTDGYVMLPFLYSGLWYGAMGGLTCWLIIFGFWNALSQPIVELSTLYLHPFQPTYPSLKLLAMLMAGTGFIGIIGAWLASWRQLRLIEP